MVEIMVMWVEPEPEPLIYYILYVVRELGVIARRPV